MGSMWMKPQSEQSFMQKPFAFSIIIPLCIAYITLAVFSRIIDVMRPAILPEGLERLAGLSGQDILMETEALRYAEFLQGGHVLPVALVIADDDRGHAHVRELEYRGAHRGERR